MAGPWEKYATQQQETKPWEKYGATAELPAEPAAQVDQVVQEGQPIPAGYETYHDPMQGTMMRPIPQEPSIGEQALGVGETALALGTGATTGAAGHIFGTLQGLAEAIRSGKYGTEEGARMVEQAAQDLASRFTYEPRTEAGKEFTAAAGEALAPLEALTPLAAEAGAVAKTMRGPTVAKAISPEMQAVKAAEQVGIKTMTSDIKSPKTFAAKWLQSTGERIPLAGTGGAREAQQVQRINAVRDVMRQFGAEDAAQATDDVMKDLAKTRSKQITKYADMKKDVFNRLDERGAVPVDNALKEIDAQIAKFQGLKTENVNPLVERLQDFKNSIQGQGINNLEELRKVLGDSMSEQDMISVKGLGEKASSKIYGALKEDFGNFIKENGERRDFTKWNVANKQLSGMMDELKSTTLKSTLKRGDATPEAVRSMLFSKKPSDIKLLYKNLSPEGKKNARVALLHEAVEKSGGIENISPDRFLNNIEKLGKQTDIFFTGEDKKVLDGLSKALSVTKRAGEFAANPPTGVQLSIPIGAAVLTDILGGAGAATAGGASIGLAARMYESPAVRSALIRISEAKPGTVAADNAISALFETALSVQQEEK